MGIVIPPWVSEKWFQQCPFNYCDHFGDYTELAKVCRLCRMSVEESRSKDKFLKTFEEAAESPSENLKKKQLEINRVLSYFRNYEQEIDNIAEGYSIIVRGMMNEILRLYRLDRLNRKVKFQAFDVLAHSEHYIFVKIKRALSSKKEESRSSISRELADSKTSALLAYMAVDRNARVGNKLATYNTSSSIRTKFLEFSKSSVRLLKLIKREFFPEYDLELKEFGCDSYNKIFKQFKISEEGY